MSLYSQGTARRSLIDTVAFRALSQLATVAGFAVMVRGMSEESFGVYNLLYSFIPVVSTVASLGLEQILRRYQPEYLRAGNKVAAAWLTRTIASARFGVNVVLLTALLAGWNHFAPLFQLTPYRGAFMVFSVLVLLHFQAQIVQLALASHMLHRYSVGAIATLSIGKLVAYSLLVAFHSLTLETAIYADIAAYVVAFVFLRVAYHRHCLPATPAEPYRPDGEQRRRMLRYGLFNNFNDAGTLLMDARTDNFFIAAFIDPIAVGIYAFYTRLNEMLGNVLPVRLFENVIQPMFFAIPPEEAKKRLPQYFTFLLNINLLLQWPLLAFCLVYHAEIVTVIFGGKFVERSWLLPLLIGFSVVNTVGTPVTLVAQYQERAGVILLSKAFAIYNVAMMLVLLPAFGLYGAAFARGSGQALKNIFIWWHVRGDAVWTNASTAIPASLLLWGGIAVTCYTLKTYIHLHALLHLMMGAAICAAAALVHMRGRAVSDSDRRILASVFKGRETRHLRRLGLLPRLGSDHVA
jgi:O-antigen/teichoic acid export membrane protein